VIVWNSLRSLIAQVVNFSSNQFGSNSYSMRYQEVAGRKLDTLISRCYLRFSVSSFIVVQGLVGGI